MLNNNVKIHAISYPQNVKYK